jgi:diguanylate cyclase (GGDEF)-like protein
MFGPRMLDFDHAFQPIVGMTSLRTHGMEALLRPRGGAEPGELLDAAWTARRLVETERALIDGALAKFARAAFPAGTRLFCNLDNRVFGGSEDALGSIAAAPKRHGLEPTALCLELSERLAPESADAMEVTVERLLGANLRIAIDDFGTGFSGLHMLMRVQPHYVKIDRFFVTDLAHDPRKQVVVANVVRLAHSLGFMIVAEGIETEAEFRTAREIGCDLAQGYLIARPTTELSELRPSYGHVVAASPAAGRLSELAEPVPCVPADAPIADVIAAFSAAPSARLIPVVDGDNQPLGAVYEADVKPYLYNQFGHALLANKGFIGAATKLMKRCPISDVGAPVDAVVDNFVVAGGTDGLILTRDGRYAGFLPNGALLRLVAERDVAIARDQNPLTYLPGNGSISRHIGQVLSIGQADCTLVAFDFDGFKAFNDTYGFLRGDRALRMFADQLRLAARREGAFVAHIGGDDFFMSLPQGAEAAQASVARLVDKFAQDVASLYDGPHRAAGGITALDRAGVRRFFPLLRASAALLPLPAERAGLTEDDIVAKLVEAKNRAKASREGYAVADAAPVRDARQLQSELRLAI